MRVHQVAVRMRPCNTIIFNDNYGRTRCKLGARNVDGIVAGAISLIAQTDMYPHPRENIQHQKKEKCRPEQPTGTGAENSHKTNHVLAFYRD